MSKDRALAEAQEAAEAAPEAAFEAIDRLAMVEAGPTGVIRRRQERISLTIAPEMLAKVDEMAIKMGQSRGALIHFAIYRLIEGTAA